MNDEDDQPEVEITIDARRFAGVWANASRVYAGVDQFTIDFVRIDPRERRGMVVARVTLAPGFMRSFVEQCESVWHTWAERSLPSEARGK